MMPPPATGSIQNNNYNSCPRESTNKSQLGAELNWLLSFGFHQRGHCPLFTSIHQFRSDAGFINSNFYRLWNILFIPPPSPVIIHLKINERNRGNKIQIHWDHTQCRALVLPKQSPGLLGTILDVSSLWRRILKWLNHPSKLVLILLTTEGWQAESTSSGINSTAEWDLNSGPKDPEPTTLTIKQRA